jgi:Rha family phage regulatory protein
VLNRNGQLVIDSREIAEMMGTNHWEVLRKLEGSKDRKGYIKILADNHLVVSDYFIESSYIDESGKENKCYQFTKMGCEFIANKFTGEKGILFTAMYVKKFNEMEEATKSEPKQLSPMEQLRLQYAALEEHDKKIQGVAKKVDDLELNMPLFNVECKELQSLVKKVGTKILGGYRTPAYNDNSLRGRVYSDIQHQLRREFGVERYEAIKRVQLSTAREIVEDYTAPMVLREEIELANNQLIM